jgi:hypothetical protein
MFSHYQKKQIRYTSNQYFKPWLTLIPELAISSGKT